MDRADTSRQTELYNMMRWSNANSMIIELRNKNKFEHRNVKQYFNTWK